MPALLPTTRSPPQWLGPPPVLHRSVPIELMLSLRFPTYSSADTYPRWLEPPSILHRRARWPIRLAPPRLRLAPCLSNEWSAGTYPRWLGPPSVLHRRARWPFRHTPPGLRHPPRFPALLPTIRGPLCCWRSVASR